MNKLPSAALFLTLLLGCTSLGTAPRDDRQVQMPHYTFTAPAGEDWVVQIADNEFESVTLGNQVGPFFFQMELLRNVVVSQDSEAQPAKAVADDFRKVEHRNMIEEGVKPGYYQLENLVMGERVIDGRTFYTMTYDVSAGGNTQHAALYLLFPESEGNDSFIIGLYSESFPDSVPLARSFLPEFEALLQSIAFQ